MFTISLIIKSSLKFASTFSWSSFPFLTNFPFLTFKSTFLKREWNFLSEFKSWFKRAQNSFGRDLWATGVSSGSLIIEFQFFTVIDQKYDHFSNINCIFSVLANGFHYYAMPFISDNEAFQTSKGKVMKYLGIDADFSDIDIRGLCCLAAGWYFSHLYGILLPGVTAGAKLSVATGKRF